MRGITKSVPLRRARAWKVGYHHLNKSQCGGHPVEGKRCQQKHYCPLVTRLSPLHGRTSKVRSSRFRFETRKSGAPRPSRKRSVRRWEEKEEEGEEED